MCVCAHVHGVVLGWRPDFSKIGQECELCVFFWVPWTRSCFIFIQLKSLFASVFMFDPTATCCLTISLALPVKFLVLHLLSSSPSLHVQLRSVFVFGLCVCQNAAKSSYFTFACHIVLSTLFIWFCDTFFAWPLFLMPKCLSAYCQRFVNLTVWEWFPFSWKQYNFDLALWERILMALIVSFRFSD